MCLHIASEQDLISFQRCVAIQRAFPGYFSTDVVLSEQNLINLIGCVWGHRALRGARERFACGATHKMCHFREAGGAKNGRLFGRKKKFDGSALLGYPENGRGRAAAGLRRPPIPSDFLDFVHGRASGTINWNSLISGVWHHGRAAGLRGPFVGPVFWPIFGLNSAGGLRNS